MINESMFKPGDNIFLQITSISGTTDEDKLTPSIWVAQNTEIKRILGKNLYDKILSDFLSDSLVDTYLEIYDSFVSKMLVFYSVGDFIMKNSIMIGAGGNFKHQASNAVVADSKETERISKYYRDMGADFERQFYEYMQGKDIPEYQRPPSDNSFNFGWMW